SSVTPITRSRSPSRRTSRSPSACAIAPGAACRSKWETTGSGSPPSTFRSCSRTGSPRRRTGTGSACTRARSPRWSSAAASPVRARGWAAARASCSSFRCGCRSRHRHEMTASHRRILVVDDNPKIHEDFCKILSPRSAPSQLLQAEAELFGTAEPVDGSLDFEIHSAYQGDRALPLVERAVENGTPVAVAFVDIRMPPGLNGVETARELWSIDPRLQLVLCTAYSDYSWEEMVAELGARGGFLILKKPFDSIEVRQLARALSEKWRLLRENEAHLLSLEAQVRSRTDELERALERLRDEMADRLRLEKELRHAQKLEALGRLVAGIGH